MNQKLIVTLERQNRLLKQCVGLLCLALVVLFLVHAKAADVKTKFSEIDVERINVVNANGKTEMVIANRNRLPHAIINGKEAKDERNKPGMLFYNERGDECGGLIYDGNLDAQGNPAAGVHFSMDRFGGDQQLALGHYENDGFMESGLNIFDRGLEKNYGPLYEAYLKQPPGQAKEELKKKWQAAGGEQVQRLFVGKTRGQSSALILADAKGNPRIMMIVSPEGKAMLQFYNDQGEVIQSLPQVEEKKN